MTRLLVTGAAGMLGRAVVAQARADGHAVTALGRAELDITDAAAVEAAIARAEPEALINCAAWTDVDGAEADPAGAAAINGDGPARLAQAAARAGTALVHVSTDYVFPGDAQRPYVESDPTGPRSEYGRSKLLGEQAVLAADPGHAVARTSWLFGVGGKNFVETMLTLAGDGREEVSVVTDQRGCPTFAGHLAPALIELATRTAGAGGAASGGIHHIAGAGECTWNELAVETFAQAGIDCRVLPATSDAIARPAPRPAYSVLASERDDAIALPGWREGVRAYLRARRQAPVVVAR